MLGPLMTKSTTSFWIVSLLALYQLARANSYFRYTLLWLNSASAVLSVTVGRCS